MRYHKKVIRRAIKGGGRVINTLGRAERAGKRATMRTSSAALRNLGKAERTGKRATKRSVVMTLNRLDKAEKATKHAVRIHGRRVIKKISS